MPHRCLNPTRDRARQLPWFPADRRTAEVVPLVDGSFAIDPESLAIWELTAGEPLPQTEGIKVNYPYVHLERPTSICLTVTRACNLRCRYCFVKNRPDMQHDGTRMSVETGLKALRFCDPVNTSISFFGGEPVLEFDTIKAIVATAEWMCTGPGFHLTTNATLIDDEKAEFLAEHMFSVLASLDGPPDLHNLYRPLAPQQQSGSESYELTLAGLEVLRRHGVAERMTLRSTFTKQHPDIAGQLEHLNELCDEGLGGHVAVEPVSSSEASCIDPSIGTALGFSGDEAFALQDEYARAFDWALERARAGKHVRWHHLNQFAWRFLNRSPSPCECGAGKGYIGVDPKGRVFACHREPDLPIGHVDLGFDEQIRAKWVDNRLYLRQPCCDCWCRFACGGGCRSESFEHERDLSRPYGATCAIQQIIIANTIRLLSQLSEQERPFVVKTDLSAATTPLPAVT